MPPKISFTRDMIIHAAAELVRKEGIEKLNARNVAKAIGGSTQPIYRVFRSIDELEEAVIEKLTPIALRYMLDEADEESVFLSIGLGFLKFSREEPKIFDLLFVKGKKKWIFSRKNPSLGPLMKKMRRDFFLKDMSEQSLMSLFRDMFIYSLGLCMQKSIDIDRTNAAGERKLLHDVGGQLIAMALIREKNPGALEEMKRSFMS